MYSFSRDCFALLYTAGTFNLHVLKYVLHQNLVLFVVYLLITLLDVCLLSI